MDWQLPVVVMLVAVAAVYLARQAWRSWSGQKGCKSGCGCGPKSSQTGQDGLIPAAAVTIRRSSP
jgi:hypothetical protein